MSSKKSARPEKMSREARRARTLNVIFLVICAIMILSLLISAVARF